MIPLRLATELVYQLDHAGEDERLRNALASLPLFMALYDGETQYDYLSLRAKLCRQQHDPTEMFIENLLHYSESTPPYTEYVGVLDRAARLMERVGEWEQAARLYQELIDAATEAGDRLREGHARQGLGWLHTHRGRYDEAMDALTQALKIAGELGDRRGIAKAVGNMGVVYWYREEYDNALECYQQQQAISEELNDRSTISVAVGNIGIVYRSRGEFDRALDYYQQVLAISEELGDRPGISFAMNSMGIVYADRGEYDRARECYQQHLTISQELGDRLGTSLAVANMGLVYLNLGKYQQALEYIVRATEECRAIGFRVGVANCLHVTVRTLLEVLMPDKPELPSWLTDYVPSLERFVILEHARELAEECVAISYDLTKIDTIFSGRVLLARIDAAEGRRDATSSRLEQMLQDATDDNQRAELHYWLWRTEESEEHRIEALRLYESLLATTPKHEYRKRIDELR